MILARAFALLLAVLASWLAAGHGLAAETGAGARVVAVSAELEPLPGGGTRLSLLLSGAVEASSFVIEHPDRAVIELPDVNFQLEGKPASFRQGLVASLRCGLVSDRRSRIVIELTAPAAISRLALGEALPGGARRLVVELSRSDRESFRRAARPEMAGPDRTGAIGPSRDTRPVVAIDAGHGGTDPGAVAANGAHEKDVVLAFAKSLEARLVAGGALRVVMIRDRDVFVPLDERVWRAREAGADLLVSIHADSISRPSIRGATVYTGAERATDLDSMRLADRENAADPSLGAIASASGAEVKDILHDLTVRETRHLSHRFAGRLLGELASGLRFTPQPHREAGFRVLRAHDIPAALVEIGYLSNAQDADLMNQEGWRERTSAAMAKAIERFFAPRLAGRAAVSP